MAILVYLREITYCSRSLICFLALGSKQEHVFISKSLMCSNSFPCLAFDVIQEEKSLYSENVFAFGPGMSPS